MSGTFSIRHNALIVPRPLPTQSGTDCKVRDRLQLPPSALLETIMRQFLIERNFAAALNASAADLKAIVEINNQTGVKWLQSFLSADKRKTYCLYEAESADAIREAARRAGLPADIVIELAGELRPEVLVAA